MDGEESLTPRSQGESEIMRGLAGCYSPVVESASCVFAA
jgi:hypothetical protein